MGRHTPSRRRVWETATSAIAITLLTFFAGLALADVGSAPAPGQGLAEVPTAVDSPFQSAPSPGVYKGIDRGISIDSPVEGDVLYPGGPLEIVYRVTGDQTPTTLHFVLSGPGRLELLDEVRYFGSDASPQTVSLAVPDNARTGRYLIYAYSAANANQGLSDEFRVQRNDLALEEIRFDWRERSGNWPLTARVRNVGSTFDGEVTIDLSLALFGVSDVRSFTRELRLGAGSSTDLVLTRLDGESLRRYQHQCGLPMTAELRVSAGSVPDVALSNNVIGGDLYLPFGGLRIRPSIVVARRDGMGGARVAEGGSLGWTYDLGVSHPDSGRTTDLVTAIHVKNCDARPLSEGVGGSVATGETVSYRATVSGTWPCGGGRLGDCPRDELVVWGPVPARLTNGPGEERSIPMSLPGLHQVSLRVDLEVTSLPGGHSWVRHYDGDSFRFFIFPSR